jgi:hypothetical protein
VAVAKQRSGGGAHFVENLHYLRVVFENTHPGLRLASAFPPRKGEGEESAGANLICTESDSTKTIALYFFASP